MGNTYGGEKEAGDDQERLAHGGEKEEMRILRIQRVGISAGKEIGLGILLILLFSSFAFARVTYLVGDDPTRSQTPLGTLVTETIRKATGAQVVMVDAGSLLSLVGKTAEGKKLAETEVYPQQWYLIQIPAKLIEQAVRNGVGYLPKRSNRFLQLAGIKVHLLRKGNRFLFQNTSLNPQNKYLVALPAYLAHGGGPMEGAKLDLRSAEEFDPASLIRAALKKLDELPPAGKVYEVITPEE